MKYILGAILGIALIGISAVLIAIEVNLMICLPITVTGWILMAYTFDKYLYP